MTQKSLTQANRPREVTLEHQRAMCPGSSGTRSAKNSRALANARRSVPLIWGHAASSIHRERREERRDVDIERRDTFAAEVWSAAQAFAYDSELLANARA